MNLKIFRLLTLFTILSFILGCFGEIINQHLSLIRNSNNDGKYLFLSMTFHITFQDYTYLTLNLENLFSHNQFLTIAPDVSNGRMEGCNIDINNKEKPVLQFDLGRQMNDVTCEIPVLVKRIIRDETQFTLQYNMFDNNAPVGEKFILFNVANLLTAANSPQLLPSPTITNTVAFNPFNGDFAGVFDNYHGSFQFDFSIMSSDDFLANAVVPTNIGFTLSQITINRCDLSQFYNGSFVITTFFEKVTGSLKNTLQHSINIFEKYQLKCEYTLETAFRHSLVELSTLFTFPRNIGASNTKSLVILSPFPYASLAVTEIRTIPDKSKSDPVHRYYTATIKTNYVGVFYLSNIMNYYNAKDNTEPLFRTIVTQYDKPSIISLTEDGQGLKIDTSTFKADNLNNIPIVIDIYLLNGLYDENVLTPTLTLSEKSTQSTDISNHLLDSQWVNQVAINTNNFNPTFVYSSARELYLVLNINNPYFTYHLNLPEYISISRMTGTVVRQYNGSYFKITAAKPDQVYYAQDGNEIKNQGKNYIINLSKSQTMTTFPAYNSNWRDILNNDNLIYFPITITSSGTPENSSIGIYLSLVNRFHPDSLHTHSFRVSSASLTYISRPDSVEIDPLMPGQLFNLTKTLEMSTSLCNYETLTLIDVPSYMHMSHCTVGERVFDKNNGFSITSKVGINSVIFTFSNDIACGTYSPSETRNYILTEQVTCYFYVLLAHPDYSREPTETITFNFTPSTPFVPFTSQFVLPLGNLSTPIVDPSLFLASSMYSEIASVGDNPVIVSLTPFIKFTFRYTGTYLLQATKNDDLIFTYVDFTSLDHVPLGYGSKLEPFGKCTIFKSSPPGDFDNFIIEVSNVGACQFNYQYLSNTPSLIGLSLGYEERYLSTSSDFTDRIIYEITRPTIDVKEPSLPSLILETEDGSFSASLSYPPTLIVTSEPYTLSVDISHAFQTDFVTTDILKECPQFKQNNAKDYLDASGIPSVLFSFSLNHDYVSTETEADLHSCILPFTPKSIKTPARSVSVSMESFNFNMKHTYPLNYAHLVTVNPTIPSSSEFTNTKTEAKVTFSVLSGLSEETADSNSQSYVRYFSVLQNNFKSNIKSCSIVSGKDHILDPNLIKAVPIKSHQGDYFTVGPINQKINSKVTVDCIFDVSAKYNKIVKSVFYTLFSDEYTYFYESRLNKETDIVNYITSSSSFSVPHNSNPEATATKSSVVPVLSWSYSTAGNNNANKPVSINQQVENAKQFVATAMAVPPQQVYLIDLVYSKESPKAGELLSPLYHMSYSDRLFNALADFNGQVQAKFGVLNSQFTLEQLQGALEEATKGGNHGLNDLSTSAIVDDIIQQCLSQNLGCGALCAPCTGSENCVSNFDCFSGTCSFGKCTKFDYSDDPSDNNSFTVSRKLPLFFASIVLAFCFFM